MPRANLKGQAEVEFLRKTVRIAFESKANRTLIANTNKGNYVRLSEEISEIAHAKAQGTVLEKMDLTVSEGQVRSLFIESNKDFLDYFVQACYFYAHGVGRETFLAQPENSDLIKTWEQENNTFINVPYGLEASLQEEKVSLENKISSLKKWIIGLVLVAILGFIGTTFIIFFNQNKNRKSLERLSIWTGNKDDITKEDLLPQLDFMKTESSFLSVVDTIVQSLTTPSVFFNSDATLPIVTYKNIVKTSGYKKYGNSFYPDQISIIPFHGFDSMRLDTAIAKTHGMASYLNKLYGQIALQNGETHVKKDILAKIMRLENSDFDVDLIYVGYKQDVNNADSDDFMLRYPPYKLDESDLQNYIMVTRQWWKEAVNKTGIYWQQTFNGQPYYCGISKLYPTVRTHAPNQRTFWVEIKPNALDDKTKMVLAIDLILKD
jgi:hypothetical protein